jgi:hypothetical protein
MNFPTPWSNVHLPSYNASGQLLSCRKKMRGNPYPVPPHFKIKRRNGCWFPSLYFSAIVTQCFNTPIDCSTKLNEFFRLGMNRRYRPLAMSLLTVLYKCEPPSPPSKYQKLLPRQHFNFLAIATMSGVLPQAIENGILREL